MSGDLVTITEAATATGLSRSYLYALVQAGAVAIDDHSRVLRISLASLAATGARPHLKERPQQSAKRPTRPPLEPVEWQPPRPRRLRDLGDAPPSSPVDRCVIVSVGVVSAVVGTCGARAWWGFASLVPTEARDHTEGDGDVWRLWRGRVPDVVQGMHDLGVPVELDGVPA